MAMILVLAGMLAAGTVRGAVIYVTSDTGGKVGEYTTAGGTISANLITGLTNPYGITSDASGNLYTGSIGGNGTIGKYAADGTILNASLITGVKAIGLAVNGTDLYASKYNLATVGQYTTAGGTTFSTFISGLSTPYGIALDGLGHLYVANQGGTGAIGEYYTSNGTAVNTSLTTVATAFGIAYGGGNLYVSDFAVTGHVYAFDATTGAPVSGFTPISIARPTGISIYGGSLFVASYTGGTIGEYYTSNGTAINATLISGLTTPVGVLVVPEPSTAVLVLLVGGALLLLRRWNRARMSERRIRLLASAR
jgi:hypothetical protein